MQRETSLRGDVQANMGAAQHLCQCGDVDGARYLFTHAPIDRRRLGGNTAATFRKDAADGYADAVGAEYSQKVSVRTERLKSILCE